MDLRPVTALAQRAAEEIRLPIEAVVSDDIVLVPPGAAVPADGVVIAGSSSVNESLITGESMPVAKQEGSELIGGTLNGSGLLRMRATRVGSATALAQIIRIVEEAQASSAPVQRLADQATAWFVPAVVLVALLTLLLWSLAGQVSNGLLAFIAVLVISCPCALGIATPAALMVGVERLTTVVFDKTGTLTRGTSALTALIACMAPMGEEQVLQLAASQEHGSSHPLAGAILEAAEARQPPLLPVRGARPLRVRGCRPGWRRGAGSTTSGWASAPCRQQERWWRWWAMG
ncbi:MAG: HAD-IC family P-type ATPase [Prochlorococcaceae cyanobacterium]